MKKLNGWPSVTMAAMPGRLLLLSLTLSPYSAHSLPILLILTKPWKGQLAPPLVKPKRQRTMYSADQAREGCCLWPTLDNPDLATD